MNKKLFLRLEVALLVVVLIILSSCRNTKELIYMHDTENDEILQVAPPIESDYHLKGNDILYVSIKSLDPEVNTLFNPESGMEVRTTSMHQRYTTPQGAYIYGYEVNNEGLIHLPILGKIDVAGRSVAGAESNIQEVADGFLKDAVVKVKLLNYRVNVMGEVKQPGIYYIYNNNPTVMEAISMANGNTDFANINKVLVLRPLPDGSKKAIVLDLNKKESLMSEGFYLHPNDYVYVEPDQYKNFQLNSQAFSLMFSSISILLAVIGFAL